MIAARGHRRTVLWSTALVHRLSGLGLSLFLPFHFLALGLALQGADKLDGFLRLTQLPAFKLGESALVFLLVVHFLGGLRLLALEVLPWFGAQKKLAVGAAAASCAAAIAFLLLVF